MKSFPMTRREVLAATAAGALAPNVALPQAPPKPNIVYIMADDMGYADLSCYGRREYKTPNIDSLAVKGTRFLQAYANSAVCSATRTGLITGRYQYRLRVGLEEPIQYQSKYGLPPEHPTLPSLLKKAGYGTTLIGKWHLGGLPDFGPLKSGYDHFWGFRWGSLDYFTHKYGISATDTEDLWDDDVKIHQTGYLTDLMGDRAVKVIGDYASARQPFFLSLHFNAPHWPWEGPGDEAESQRIKAMVDRDGGSMKTYARMVAEMDVQVGRVLKALDAARLAGNTIVVFTSDNGGERFSDTWPFTGKKSDLLEGGLRIPALARWPGHIRAGATTDQVAISMDWMPTFLAAAGTQPDPAYPSDGMNLLPQLTGSVAPVPRTLFWRYHFNSQRAMRDGDMKYLRIGGNEFLFNVVEDPLERANLKDRQPEAFKRMAAAYEEWNATMLPDASDIRSGPLGYADELADHVGIARPANPGGKRDER
ncbi:MAG TPA: sulfatase-like hydrolase/transferase [Bryobacteraceae bacterium]|nr:sulfatase-like hydrolase/transferase [Bryobacteraceae bacterium]